MHVDDIEKLEHVRERIRLVRQWLVKNPPGTVSVAREGFSAGYSRNQAIKELKGLEIERDRLTGRKRPAVRPINLSRSWNE